MTHYDVIGVLRKSSDRNQVQDFIGSSRFFDVDILSFHNDALRVWRSVARHYAVNEVEYRIPYSFAETAKLYALDALCLTAPLIKNDDDKLKLAELFTVFYLIVHLFDDHVEHRDKFYSKFDFSTASDIDTQRGAAPFSFMLLSFSILTDILSSISQFNQDERADIMREMYAVLARQTRYFASERQASMSIDETLEVKQRQVAGKTLAMFGDIIARYTNMSAAKAKRLHEGLVYLGSLTQITDDIRDKSIDSILRNANIVNTAARVLGDVAGEKRLDSIYQEEAGRAREHLEHVFTPQYVSVLLSLPFYPFMIDKQQLKDGA